MVTVMLPMTDAFYVGVWEGLIFSEECQQLERLEDIRNLARRVRERANSRCAVDRHMFSRWASRVEQEAAEAERTMQRPGGANSGAANSPRTGAKLDAPRSHV
jgi:hypothetical protein